MAPKRNKGEFMNIKIGKHVEEALKNNQPVVALESTIISHGMSYPENVETALMCEETVFRIIKFNIFS